MTPEARAWLDGHMSAEDYFAWAYAQARLAAVADVERRMRPERWSIRRWFADRSSKRAGRHRA